MRAAAVATALVWALLGPQVRAANYTDAFIVFAIDQCEVCTKVTLRDRLNGKPRYGETIFCSEGEGWIMNGSIPRTYVHLNQADLPVPGGWASRAIAARPATRCLCRSIL
jgi:hypothetical protein